MANYYRGHRWSRKGKSSALTRRRQPRPLPGLEPSVVPELEGTDDPVEKGFICIGASGPSATQ